MTRLAAVTGEASGDLIAAQALGPLVRQGVALEGIGGPALAALGMDCWFSSDRLAVRGYVEALARLPDILSVRRALLRRLCHSPPDVFLGVDAPDFNLELASRLKAQGIYCYHLVGPSIWAWRPERKWKIAKAVDHLLLLFPFEQALYAETGLKTTYVGHPMADQIEFNPDRLVVRKALGLDRMLLYQGQIAEVRTSGTDVERSRWFCLLPGSRIDEIRQHAVRMLEAAQHLAIRYPQSVFLMPAASARIYELLKSLLGQHISVGSSRVILYRGRARDCIAASDQVLAATGTVCLEAALMGRPMVIVYRMPELSYRWMKRLQLQPWIGLPNILAQRFLVPELIQSKASPKLMVQALEQQWDDREGLDALRDALYRNHQTLRCDSASRAAPVIQHHMQPS